MANAYFANPGNILPNQRARASDLSSDLDLVVAAFDLLPAPDQVATVNYVNNLAFSGNLPGQPGNAGLYLRTDGLNPSWADPFDNPTFTGIVTMSYGAVIPGYATLVSPTFTGSPAAPTPTTGDISTKIATTAFVSTALANKANVNSPTFSGIVTIPSGASISGYATLASPALTGTPTAPTATTGTNNAQIATTAFVQTATFPAGTRMLFCQASAPTGWTQVTTWNDRYIRIVSGNSGGTSGGTTGHLPSSGCTLVASHTHTYSGTTGNNNSTHYHSMAASGDPPSGSGVSMHGPGDWALVALATTSTESAPHTHSYSGTSAANTGAATWIPQFLDVIVCQKS
jgi:hypothetical protein